MAKGDLFAFLGQNGAGKSTTIDTICTLLQPDSGHVIANNWELGQSDDKIRASIGAVFQGNLLDKLLTVEENLKLRASLYGFDKKTIDKNVSAAIDAAGVREFCKRPYGKLCGGQRRLSDITRSLVNTPAILFLDEPTTGLDPQTRKNVWKIIRKLQTDTGMTIFLTTHYMEEAADADYIVVIDDGMVAAAGTPSELKNRYARDKMILTFSDINQGERFLLDHAIEYSQVADQFLVRLADTRSSIQILTACQSILQGFEVVKGSMDDVFIEITGKEIRFAA